MSVWSGLWNCTPCNTNAPYICSVPSAPQPTCPAVTPRTSSADKIEIVCPSGWTYYAHSRKCYKLIYGTTFYGALSICETFNTTLASIHDAETNNWMADFAGAHLVLTGRGAVAWIGLYDPLQTGNWRWTDGSLFDFANWSPGQPDGDNEGGKEHCAALNTDLGTDSTWSPHVPKWDDYQCELTFRAAVCQMIAAV